MNEHEDVEGAAHREVLRELPRQLSPRPAVEDRIVSALRVRGLIREAGRRPPPIFALGAVAAGLALLAAGYVLGRGSASRPSAKTPAPRFALFLLRGAEGLPERPEEETGRVAEYRVWARGLAAAGRLVTGEKLADQSARIGEAGSGGEAAPEEEIRGYFIISASDFGEALAVARGCPHLRHGGRILVRPIAPV